MHLDVKNLFRLRLIGPCRRIFKILPKVIFVPIFFHHFCINIHIPCCNKMDIQGLAKFGVYTAGKNNTRHTAAYS